MLFSFHISHFYTRPQSFHIWTPCVISRHLCHLCRYCFKEHNPPLVWNGATKQRGEVCQAEIAINGGKGTDVKSLFMTSLFLNSLPSLTLTHSLTPILWHTFTHTHTQAPFWCTSHWHNYPYSYNYQQIPNPNSYFDSNLMLFFAQLQTKSWTSKNSLILWESEKCPQNKSIYFFVHTSIAASEKTTDVFQGWRAD